ncbi:MAG TPA: hypothetical protein DGG95_01485 [Cytophagales bacterium]|jgi:hypothetical protein|nr:hypothetical protein [Cytophagales bacterium]
MKTKFQICVFAVILLGCSKTNNVSPKENFLSSLTGHTWVTQSVYNETDGDLTSLYTNFSIVFTKGSSNTGGNYSVVNGSRAFANSSGTWVVSDDLKTITLNGTQAMNVTLNGNLLKLDFMLPAKSGRLSGLTGHFIFLLTTIG